MQLCLSTTTQHLEGILELQQQNLKKNLPPDLIDSDGFLTVEHQPDLLAEMNALQKHVIAVDRDKVVGYALSMSPVLSSKLPVLEPMFKKIESLSYKGQKLTDSSWYIMGQICVAAPFRGTGLFSKLYEEHRIRYADRFDYLITEVSAHNPRSLRAHERTGFQTIATYRDNTDLWHLVLWDWNNTMAPSR